MLAETVSWKRKHYKALRDAIDVLEANPTASESISTPNGGSRSVTYSSLASLYSEMRQLEAELAENAIANGSPMGFTVITPHWC